MELIIQGICSMTLAVFSFKSGYKLFSNGVKKEAAKRAANKVATGK